MHISNKFGTKHPWFKNIQVKIKNQTLCKSKILSKTRKSSDNFMKYLSSKPLGQHFYKTCGDREVKVQNQPEIKFHARRAATILSYHSILTSAHRKFLNFQIPLKRNSHSHGFIP